jgi:sulfide:quinone oxidoreductase
MTRLIKLEDDVFVAPQLVESDFAELAAKGFRSVVNNRPDGEAPDQLPNRGAEAAARHSGLEFRHLPVTYLNVTEDAVVDAFARLRAELPGPILFYCRSGNRCATLWAQVAVAKLGVEGTLDVASAAGFNLEALRHRLTVRAGAAAD